MAISPTKTITNEEGTFKVREGSRMDVAAGSPPPPAPTIADTYSKANIALGDTSKEDKAYARREKQLLRDSSAKVDENSIFKNQMRKFQSEIDATNQIYAQKLADQKQVGLGALGSSRAVQARSGLLGSDYGLSQTSGVQAQNLAQEDLVRQEQGAKVQAILGKGRAAAAQELAEKRAAQQAGQKDYIDFLGASAERRAKRSTGLAEQFLDQEVDPDKIDPAELARIAKSSGVQVADIKSNYSKLKVSRAKEAAAAALEGQFSLSPEEMRFDAEGKLIASGGPKTFAPPSTTPKPANVTQQKALGFYERAKFSQDVVKPLEEKIAEMGLPGQVGLQFLPNIFQSAENQSYRQAQRAFTEARLRQESGAAIPPAEYENDARTYFAVPGDTPETIEQKRAGRQIIVDNLARSAGPAFEEAYGAGFQVGEEVQDARSLLEAADIDYDALRGAYPGLSDDMLLQEARDQGLVSFNQVGNTTASTGNLPQRNNNPGNVKVGGLGDRFASRDALGRPLKDAQGHLIFPNPQAGLKALEADINAKITGNSHAAQNKLGKQIGTLAELNAVYAEDPNWKNNVIAFLGRQGVRANASTPVSSIPKRQLIQAIMQSEGYYA